MPRHERTDESRTDRDARFQARTSQELLDAAAPWEYGEKQEFIDNALKERAYEGGIVDTEAVIETTREQLVMTISAFERLEREFSNMPPVAERIKEMRIEQTHAIARMNHERRKQIAAAGYAGPEERVSEDDLEWLEQQTIHNGERVFPTHGKVQEVTPPDVTAEEIVALLRERNPDLPDSMFEDGNEVHWTDA